MSKVCLIERNFKGSVTFFSPFGWTPAKEVAMRFTERGAADTHLSRIILPPGSVRVIETEASDDAPRPEIRTDYDPFGLQR